MTRADRDALTDMADTLADILRRAPHPFPGWPTLFRYAVLQLSNNSTLADAPETRYHIATYKGALP
jgi:hypothetical protein